MTNTLNNTSMKKLTRQQLELINRRTLKYPLDIAQKDYFLALAINNKLSSIKITRTKSKEIYKFNQIFIIFSYFY